MLAKMPERRPNEFRLIHLLMPLMLAITACGGDAQFASNNAVGSRSGGSGGPGGPNDPTLTEGRLLDMSWQWQCKMDEGRPMDESDPGHAILFGGGDHNLARSRVNKTPLTFNGSLCPAESIPRDIVFVVDVSGSMADFGKDPSGFFGPKKCQRLTAVVNLIRRYAKGDQVRFAVTTFSDAASVADTATSTGFFANETALFNDLGVSADPGAALCAALSGTEYELGLQAAENLLAKGREGASKEIYFISDGEPNEGHTGATDAARLKAGIAVGNANAKVTIATVMIGGDDTILRTQIASPGPDGQPLHAFLENADRLAATLEQLTNNSIVGAELSYGPIGTPEEDWTTFNVLDFTSGLTFSLPETQIDPADAPDGLGVHYRYRDQRGSEYDYRGQIVWEER